MTHYNVSCVHIQWKSKRNTCMLHSSCMVLSVTMNSTWTSWSMWRILPTSLWLHIPQIQNKFVCLTLLNLSMNYRNRNDLNQCWLIYEVGSMCVRYKGIHLPMLISLNFSTNVKNFNCLGCDNKYHIWGEVLLLQKRAILTSCMDYLGVNAPQHPPRHIGIYVLKVVLHYTHLCQHQLQPWLYKLSNHVYKAVDNRCHQNTKIASTDLNIAAMTGENRCCRLL